MVNSSVVQFISYPIDGEGVHLISFNGINASDYIGTEHALSCQLLSLFKWGWLVSYLRVGLCGGLHGWTDLAKPYSFKKRPRQQTRASAMRITEINNK